MGARRDRAGRLFCGYMGPAAVGWVGAEAPLPVQRSPPWVLPAPLSPWSRPQRAPPCLAGLTRVQRHALCVCSARARSNAGAAALWVLTGLRGQRCVSALSQRCGSAPVGLVVNPLRGLLALAVAFEGSVCSVLLPGGFRSGLCQLTHCVPIALHSCQHCPDFNHCQSGGCENGIVVLI